MSQLFLLLQYKWLVDKLSYNVYVYTTCNFKKTTA